MSNVISGVYEHDSYALFDQLPRLIRRILADADYDHCVAPVLAAYRSSGSAAEVIAQIRRADIMHHRRTARREKRTVFGKGGRPIR
jgi:L-rhamnose isomerase